MLACGKKWVMAAVGNWRILYFIRCTSSSMNFSSYRNHRRIKASHSTPANVIVNIVGSCLRWIILFCFFFLSRRANELPWFRISWMQTWQKNNEYNETFTFNTRMIFTVRKYILMLNSLWWMMVLHSGPCQLCICIMMRGVCSCFVSIQSIVIFVEPGEYALAVNIWQGTRCSLAWH